MHALYFLSFIEKGTSNYLKNGRMFNPLPTRFVLGSTNAIESVPLSPLFVHLQVPFYVVV